MLEAARSLGDGLVVLLNSDRSVQGLKGAERPIVGQDDRAAVLRSLQCVDAVEIFDETTPVQILERIRPDLFVKGDDYGAGQIPESAVLQRWGGSVVVVPYLEGRSTTRLIEEAS
jgi:rfaE bifunctional protein nucleotidyltransferase chain/domain